MAKNVTVPPHIVNDLNPMMTFSQNIGWGLVKLNIESLHKKGFTGKGVKIGIIDSGCNLNHPDLKISSSKNFTESNSCEDTSGHGTHVAGIIAAQGNSYGVLGIAPDAEIHIYKALDGTSGSIKGVIDALKTAIYSSKTTLKTANIAVSGSAVITKIISIPCSLTDSEMEEQIMIEADQYIPNSLDEVNFDFEVQGVNKNNPEREAKKLSGSSPKILADYYIDDKALEFGNELVRIKTLEFLSKL